MKPQIKIQLRNKPDGGRWVRVAFVHPSSGVELASWVPAFKELTAIFAVIGACEDEKYQEAHHKGGAMQLDLLNAARLFKYTPDQWMDGGFARVWTQLAARYGLKP